MSIEPWGPLGLALRDYHRGELTASVTVFMDDGTSEQLPAAHFFRSADDLPELEAMAVDLCRGSVLDLGAGSGVHALALQRRGFDVLAVDVSPLAVEIMRQRGVRNVKAADLFELVVDPVDTVLLLMNGIGVVGTLAGLDRFLELAARWTKPGGQVLFDSTDVRKTRDLGERRALEQRLHRGLYHGELRFQFEYRGKTAPAFSWLFVDADTLRARAQPRGWKTDVLAEREGGEYLVRLRRAVAPVSG